ncbi:hypothetical protein [uncultured Bacteroides sp.]|uniref:hypothetical protein n=1 Tax=uncultured Bacteroides sp. TaxID=162156 RepID=UPI002AA5ED0A|nr:hypothetical protein [uncultured Bacteroides sp.]
MKINRIITALLFCTCLPLGTMSSFGQGTGLRAGTAKTNITPDNPGKPLHDSLYARSLILDNGSGKLAFVSIDLGAFSDPELENYCKEKYGLKELFFSASHTHSGASSNNPKFLEDKIMKLLAGASKNMFQARLAAGHKSFPQLGFNRLIRREDGHSRESWFTDDHYIGENPDRIPFGPVDPEVGIIKVEDMSGQPRAIIMNYAMHADVVCSNYEISADYPGVACRKVEEAFGPQMTCLFVQGAGGDIESLIISSRRKGPDDPFKSDYRTIERVGGLLAWETIDLAKSLEPSIKDQGAIKFMDDSLHFKGRFKKDAEYNVQISTILIDNKIVIATCPGEPFIRLQLDLKRRLRDAGAIPFLFAYTWRAGTWPNYIPDIQSAARGGYGVDQVWPEPIAVGAGEAIMNKHLENFFWLNGLMRKEPGPSGFKGISQWVVKEIPGQ